MSRTELLIRPSSRSGTYAVYGTSDFGYRSFNAAAWPDRLFAGLDEASRPSSTITEPELDVTVLSSPLESLLRGGNAEGEGLAQETRRAIARLEALWLLSEDRYRLLDAQPIDPLAHQASLVEHVLADPNLRRVLIADEVGLGKTIEAALIVQRLIESRSGPPPRVLYLTQAGLVDNVVDEFVRLGLSPRRWTSWATEARLDPGASDALVVASIHRAVFQIKGGVNHFETVARSGPWDVLIIDEAHHLSDWSADGSDPQQRMKLVRRLVQERLTPGGRLLLLSGTPHQGHGDKFWNLLRLLCAENESEDVIRGRVIYRIKDDIRDWDEQPLFPVRDVRPPTLIDSGPDYQRWLQLVHRVLTVAGGSRAAGWRRAQALQWCASSPQAGVAYLVRLALRAGIRSKDDAALYGALSALRPYRERSASEPVEGLEAFLRSPLAEFGEDDADEFRGESELLGQALSAGKLLIESNAIVHKMTPVFDWLAASPDEKFVIFAQPIETVFTLKQRLEARLGVGSVALIVGGQDRDVRRQEIEKFRRADGARVLVSSRSGGEGINLQISRRLIHFDIPWNPMEMEQRVGRVHRYGSANTVVVDTLVMAESREVRILERCRARLGQIVADIDGDRFELHYSRTMSLIPLEELATLMAGEGFGPLTPDEERRIDRMVQQGYETWRQADSEFRQRSASLRALERGQADDADLESFIAGTVGGKLEPGWSRKVLVAVSGAREPRLELTEARVYRLPDEGLGFVGRDAGLGLAGPGSERVRRLGLNDASVASKLRGLFAGDTGDDDTGTGTSTASVGFTLVDAQRFTAWCETATLPTALRNGTIVCAYCVRRLDLTHTPPREVGTTVRAFVADADGTFEAELSGAALASLVRLVRLPRPKRTRPAALGRERLLALEESWVRGLRATRRGEPVAAVFPIAAIWLQPAALDDIKTARTTVDASPQKMTALARTTRGLLDKGLVLDAVRTWGDYVAGTPYALEVEDRLHAALTAGWETDRLILDPEQPLVFVQPVHVRVIPHDGRWSAELNTLSASGDGVAAHDALQSLIGNLRKEVSALVSAYTTDLPTTIRLRKRLLLGAVDVRASRVDGAAAAAYWYVGKLRRDDRGALWLCTDGERDLWFEVPTDLSVDVDDLPHLARVATDERGVPVGPVLELRDGFRGSDDDLWEAWRRLVANAG